jgi:hypothetical protein
LNAVVHRNLDLLQSQIATLTVLINYLQVTAVFTIVASLAVVLLIVAIGWWLIWKVIVRSDFGAEKLIPDTVSC